MFNTMQIRIDGRVLRRSCALLIGMAVVAGIPLTQQAYATEKHEKLGRFLGVLDAVVQAANDYERHNNHYSDDHHDAFKRGYVQGYGTVASRADMERGAQAAFDDGKALGASDATHHYNEDYRRHSDRYISDYEDAFKQGYEVGYLAIHGPRKHLETWHAAGRLRVDVNAAQHLISEDEYLSILNIPVGTGKVLNGHKVYGYRANAYTLAVPRGAMLRVEVASDREPVYFNVHNVNDQSGAAVFRGEVDGKVAVINVDDSGTYVVRPFIGRAAARRGDTAAYTMWIDVNQR